MEWYTLFKQHILDRGIEYFEDDRVRDYNYCDNEIIARVDGTELYDVHILLDDEEVLDMHCSCPYAEEGHHCKHMAAVLFAFERMLYKRDSEMDIEMLPPFSWDEKFQKEKQEVFDLVSKIPEEKVRDLLVGFVLADKSLKNDLELKYSFKMNSKLMLKLRKELNDIEYKYCRARYVDWYHASDFTSELEYFLETKVKMLIEKECLKQAFELTNAVFDCIGNVDMDDSDGNSTYVANNCYDCWKLIAEKADDAFKYEMKHWFETHNTGFVVDFMEEYIEEILMDVFPTKEKLEEEIKKLDSYISRANGNDCGKYFTVHYGFVNPILKRLEYMKKLGCTDTEISRYRSEQRKFFVIRELEISEAIEKRDYKKAVSVLQESKVLDAGYSEQLKKYSELLIDLYKKINSQKLYMEELLYHLENYWQADLTYVSELKACDLQGMKWSEIIDDIIKKNRHEDFVCKLLLDEKRYEQLMRKIEESYDKVHLLNEYEKVLRSKMPERVIKIYSDYLKQAAELANDRKKYHNLMPYLKRIAKCTGGKEAAKSIAELWKRMYKRRTAMMDELKKAGF